MFKKILIRGFFILLLSLPTFVNADNYIFYYGQGCSHCAKVEKYMKNNNIELEKKEIYFDEDNRKDFLEKTNRLGLKTEDVGVPFLYIEKDNLEETYLIGDKPIIELFIKDKDLLKKTETISKPIKEDSFRPFKFLLILFPAAISDSINPCAFAVILILLGAVLSRFKSRRKVMLTGLSFSLAIFLSYLGMGFGLYNAIGNIDSTFYFKLGVGIFGIIIGLANLKDVFWYGKGFVMEVPFSWRPKMKKILKKATSPAGGFIVGLIVSLFLLPCTSGPYLTVLGYLATENNSIQLWGYIYLIIYNIIFILPMIIITFVISFGYVSIATIMEIKEEKTELIHLIVGILMLLLGSYVIWDSLI